MVIKRKIKEIQIFKFKATEAELTALKTVRDLTTKMRATLDRYGVTYSDDYAIITSLEDELYSLLSMLTDEDFAIEEEAEDNEIVCE